MTINTKINLKRIIVLGIGGLMVFALLTGGVGNRMNLDQLVRAEEKTNAVQPQFACGTSTLAGRYAVIGHGFAGTPTAPPAPFATVSLMTLDGAGNLSNKVTRSNNGQISRGPDLGTYAVNPDCTGTITITVPTPPYQLTFDLVVAELQGVHAREFYFIATTPGGVVTSAAKRIQ
jgi:hypothetical protein